MEIGSFYEITNLVCSDIMINFSRNMVKNPKNNIISPLFCDIAITLRPSTKYSDKMLRKFVGGSKSGRRALETVINNNLETEKIKRDSAINTQRYVIDQ